MSRQSGSTFKNGYATVDGGLEYRLIAEAMESNGDKISVSTARNLLLRGLEKIAKELCILQGVPEDQQDQEARRIAFDPRFQDSMTAMLGDIYSSKN